MKLFSKKITLKTSLVALIIVLFAIVVIALISRFGFQAAEKFVSCKDDEKGYCEIELSVNKPIYPLNETVSVTVKNNSGADLVFDPGDFGGIVDAKGNIVFQQRTQYIQERVFEAGKWVWKQTGARLTTIKPGESITWAWPQVKSNLREKVDIGEYTVQIINPYYTGGLPGDQAFNVNAETFYIASEDMLTGEIEGENPTALDLQLLQAHRDAFAMAHIKTMTMIGDGDYELGQERFFTNDLSEVDGDKFIAKKPSVMSIASLIPKAWASIIPSPPDPLYDYLITNANKMFDEKVKTILDNEKPCCIKLVKGRYEAKHMSTPYTKGHVVPGTYAYAVSAEWWEFRGKIMIVECSSSNTHRINDGMLDRDWIEPGHCTRPGYLCYASSTTFYQSVEWDSKKVYGNPSAVKEFFTNPLSFTKHPDVTKKAFTDTSRKTYNPPMQECCPVPDPSPSPNSN